ncbi:cyclopropane-fatty-acyl-phospholipid synthase family protein [Pseudovibrio sp. SPO723]|uniref:cyclopropane-fatty-acyl-phospholipid synthase family protein n=1 Tax=Nesiotobacter zosterae TaxID=392721 RepID=UPI0029C1D9B8|nr:cyclopropane-fatty-acyl-phospholipid synthase family protein [Pseudovibrio sp. SPO723]MDX5594989.1 cyclopropane-fatty-acyl-phospholipid synthase family protein [Pseudovibrio sp. SPO723]
MRALARMLEPFLEKGQLIIIDAENVRHELGARAPGPKAVIRFHDRWLPLKMLWDPELVGAEAYMDGRLTLEEGTHVNDLISVFTVNRGPFNATALQKVVWSFKDGHARRKQRLDLSRNKAQVRHHYDLNTDLYRLFLDDGLNYSCAYYRTPEDTLEQAQAAKLDHLIAKLDLKPGMRVLEIGGGWGSLAIRMAQAGADVTSLNVSPEQIRIAEKRVEALRLQNNVEFICKDYNEFSGEYDRVISVGMMEHVGIGNFDAYFAKVKECLSPKGFGVIHSIGRYTPPGTTGPFLTKYIFPGGYVPSLSEVFAATERQRLWVCDAEILRLHYYYTLRAWRLRFEANWDKAKALYDERFCRMWQLYLSACEMGFLEGSTMVFQLIVSRERDAVPLLRDFIGDNERKLQAAAGHDTWFQRA